MPIVATHRLKRNHDGISALDIELARRGLRVADIVGPGVTRMTIHRLRNSEPGEPGAQTTTTTAYTIARAIDPAQADELVDTLFEVIPRHASH